MLLYALTVFVSAFLLFQVQPVIAKMILPWFGGSAMVWTSCMLFFQVALLAGYAYSHSLVRRPLARQARIHLICLAVSLLWLPIFPKAMFQPGGGDNPLFGILLALTFSVGMPFFMLATTGPLIQSWYAASHPERLPYRLFALSNFGSLLALVAYPVLVEPNLPLRVQGYTWSGLFVLFAALCGIAAWRARAIPLAQSMPTEREQPAPDQPDDEQFVVPPAPPAAPTLGQKLAWLFLAACASILLLAITNHLTQNIAAIPFLWVLPLSLYLLSFMLCFDRDRWYQPRFFSFLATLSLMAMGYTFWEPSQSDRLIHFYIGFYCVSLFFCCMFCHGEIARRKPHPRYLTSFYLMVAIGGALGGIFVGVIAPLLLPFYYELSIGLALTAVTALYVNYRESWLTDIVWAGLTVFLIATVFRDVQSGSRDSLFTSRNFYGALRIRESGTDLDGSRLRTLINGTINHGSQFVSRERSHQPTTYYGERTGVGISINQLRRPNMKVGIIGLGAGTLVTYGQPGETFKVYEINPAVRDVANTWFTYLRDCRAAAEVVLGDARLSLENEAPNEFDVLAVDAFSSDAIPVHLLTREAIELYFRHTRPDGIIALHVSNKYLNLYPVVEKIAKSLGKPAVLVESRANGASDQFSADWILLSSAPSRFEEPAFRATASTPVPEPNAPLWTDDYSNLYQVLR